MERPNCITPFSHGRWFNPDEAEDLIEYITWLENQRQTLIQRTSGEVPLILE